MSILNQFFEVTFPFSIDYLSAQDKLGFRTRKAALTAYYQRKAKAAIAQQFSSESIISSSENGSRVDDSTASTSFLAYLGPHFTWIVKEEQTSDYPWNVEVSVTEQDSLIEFYVKNPGSDPAPSSLRIEVHPTKSWKIPAKSVHLLIQSSSSCLFTAAWKAFEHYLVQERIKADLVQLNGYYQYKPAIKIKLVKSEAFLSDQNSLHEWQAIRNVLQGVGVRQIITIEHLADLWELSLEKTIDALLRLRASGYEVRSSYTNNQIPSGHVLIPYAFPTLNPLSVQLRKTLFPTLNLNEASEEKKSNE